MNVRSVCLAGIVVLNVLPFAAAVAQERIPTSEPPLLAGASENGQHIPARVIYRFFFAHLENLDRIASQLEAAGKDGKGWRSHEQRAAGLGAEEGAILKRVATDCNRAVKTHKARLQAAFAAAKAQHANTKSLPEPPPELQQLVQEGDQIVDLRIAQLRAQLGEESFQKLDSYLKKSFGAKIKMQPVATARAPRGVQ